MPAKKSAKKPEMEPKMLHRKLLALWNRGQSSLCEVRGSIIHGHGVYATQAIAAETKIIEYVGELIDKDTSEKRGVSLHDKARETGGAAVYIFTLSNKYDLDGDVPWNTARLINHSCEPNCEAWTVGRRIFIHSLSDIQAGEELTFDYGFDVECYEDHPCRCGKASCVGHIVGRAQWPDLAKKLENKTKSEG
jgi:uncharacterized protein